MKILTKSSLSLSCLFLCMSTYAFQINGNITTIINKTNQPSLRSNLNDKKEVVLMNLFLTPKERAIFFNSTASDELTKNLSQFQIPAKFDVGMNGVPVLDQGRHGSCVTFAVTAAINAGIGKGDYISQLCLLELGSHLEKYGYAPSGWNGSDGETALGQITRYGIINKENQEKYSCAGITKYPLNEMENEGNPMSLNDYKQFSENLNQHTFFHHIFDFYDRLIWKLKHKGQPDLQAQQLLHKIQEDLALQANDNSISIRVAFGTMLNINFCGAGACGSYHAPNDTWVLTKQIANDPNPRIGGHEMIITGYDNNAIVVDDEGKAHKGILMLRNSWGDNVGDHGNFYMTYDYFKIFAMEANQIDYVLDDSKSL